MLQLSKKARTMSYVHCASFESTCNEKKLGQQIAARCFGIEAYTRQQK
jgi:hypothetical protein